jgi:hypothetical protein
MGDARSRGQKTDDGRRRTFSFAKAPRASARDKMEGRKEGGRIEGVKK